MSKNTMKWPQNTKIKLKKGQNCTNKIGPKSRPIMCQNQAKI